MVGELKKYSVSSSALWFTVIIIVCFMLLDITCDIFCNNDCTAIYLHCSYGILSNRRDALIMDKAKSFPHSNAGRIFSSVGFVLHGKRRFFMKFAKVIKVKQHFSFSVVKAIHITDDNLRERQRKFVE